MNTTKRKISFLVIGILVILSLFIVYYNTQVSALSNLGYTKEVAQEKVKVTNLFDIVAKEKKDLENKVNLSSKELLSLGVSQQDIDKIISDNNKKVSQLNALEKKKSVQTDYYNTQLKTLEASALKYKIKYTYPDENVYNRTIFLKNLLSKNYSNLIKQYEKLLLKQGFTKAQISNMSNKDKTKMLSNMKKAYDKEAVKQKKQLSNFANESLRSAAMRMFAMTNEYRASKGLKPYTYNYNQQACVFKEANAYANNKNPHNWLCKAAANENAALASAKSDYIGIAMHFFKTDPPHEQVLLGNHRSVAIAIVTKDGMNYMIMDVFN